LKSKVLAESTAWDYIKTMPENERFELVSINPGLVLGPAFVGAGFTSGEFVTGIMEGTKKYLPPNNVVDVRDVAKAHLMAVKKDAAVGRRFVLVN
jgi:nucleoside-diphosphate-sugar epimerase